MKTTKIIGVTFLVYTLSGCIDNTSSSNSAPYGLKWGESYEDVRNKPTYSLEISDDHFAGENQKLITAKADPLGFKISDYNEMTLFFTKEKGLDGVVLIADVDYGKKDDNGAAELALYNKEVKIMDKLYGQPAHKEELIKDKNKFLQSLQQCVEQQKSLYMRGLNPDDAKECSKWQRDYKKGRLTVLLTIEPMSVSKQYIYK